MPVTPLPDGSGVTTGTLGPQDTTAWAFASNYQHTFSSNVLNELRIGDTRRAVTRTAAQLSTTAGAALSIPGIPSTAQFPNTLPTFLIGGYQQLGSPPNTASDFNTGVTEVADSLTWLKGRHTLKMGLDLRWERLNVIQPPSPTGSFTFNAIGSDLPGVANTGTPLASFLLGQVQLFSIDLQQGPIQERAHFQEYFIQDDWKVSDRLTINPGLRYTLNFPSTEINGQTAVFNLQTQQLEYPGTNPVRPLKKNNFGPRLGARLPAHRQDDPQRRLRPRLDRDGGHHDAVHDADLPVPADGVAARARHHLAGVRAAERARASRRSRPRRRPVSARACSRSTARVGSGYVQQWNVSVQRELTTNTTVEVAYVGSNITHVGIPDTNLNQLSVEPARARSGAQSTSRQPVLRHHPAVVVARRSDDSAGAAAQAVSGIHHGQPVSQQRRHDALSGRRAEPSAAPRARTVVLGRLHAVQAEWTMPRRSSTRRS